MPASTVKKNIVLISFDDAVAFWKYKSIFNEVLHTPNLDRICAQSTSFHNAYCQAPVCSPSRASFMSGKSPHQSGVTASDKNYFDKIPPEQMWPYTLKQNGYYCSSGGKMMRGFGPLPEAIQKTIYSDFGKRFQLEKRKRIFDDRVNTDDVERIEFGGYRGGQATVHKKDDKIFYDYQVSGSARAFFRKYDRDVPFYREVGFQGPHGPWTTPRRFKEMYNFKNIQKPDAWKDGFDENLFMNSNTPPNIDNSRLRMWKHSVRNYFSALTHTDQHLGDIWDALKASDQADSTIVIIVSDHGLHLGERNLFRKHTLWEQVANVPVIIHDPSRPVAQVITDPVALLDIGPTVMDYAGLPPLEGCVGRSLRPLVEGHSAPDRAAPTFLDNNAAIRKGKYRYIRYGDGSTQLFDLDNDWWQTKNLGDKHPAYSDMKAAHAACCLEYGFDVNKAVSAQAAAE